MHYLIDIMQYISYINNMTVSKIKLARVAKNWSQEDLAREVDVTRQTIGLVEAGNYNPTLNLCVRIAKALDCTLNDLFWEKES